MNFNPDDPKWTAYVLGELDPSERAAMDSLLQASEEARDYVQELRDATMTLQEEMKLALMQPVVPGLTREQRDAVHAAAGNRKARWWNWNVAMVGGAMAVAALILFAVALPMLRKSGKDANPYRSVMDAAKAPKPETESQTPSNAEAVKDSGIAVAAKTQAAPQTQVQPAAVPAVPSNQSAELQLAKKDQPAQQAALSVSINSRTSLETAEKKLENAVPGQVQRNPPPVVTSSIGGVVQDSTHALIPGVSVIATNTQTGVAYTTQTSDSGAFQFGNLTSGPYRLTAALTGFQTTSVPNINLGTAEPQRVDVTMNVGNGAVTMVAAKDGAGGTIRETSASVGEVLGEATRVQNLPVVGNNVLDLLTVLPGFRGQTTGTAADTVGGLGVDSVNATVNGMSTDGRLSQNGVYTATVINPDMVGEVRTILAPVNAELGKQGQLQGQGQAQGRGAAGGGGGRGGRGGGGAAAGGAPAGGGPGAAPPPAPPRPPAPMPTAAPRAIPPAADNRRADVINSSDRSSPAGGNYTPIVDNPFRRVLDEPLSTFSSDVDTASYSNLRRFLTQGQAPPRDAVRIEEMINYFNYDYAQPTGSNPIGAQMEVASAPWNPSHRLVRIGIKARDIDTRKRPQTNLVFLIDVSGSMQPPERLPLIKSGLKMLTNQLSENDHVAIVTYAGNSGVALPWTSGDRKDIIMRALDNLEAGGSTNGSAGIESAYQIAVNNFIPGGVNRVILATDGDFNLGVVNSNDLVRMIQDRAKTGVFLSVLGVGTDNLNDSMMKKLADSGNGNYAYLDSQNEANKVLVQQMGGTLVTVAKDVKLQVEFNPAVVEAYRLIGYENRLLANSDFNNDKKDAGDMGAGHTVTALYEIVPRGGEVPGPNVDDLKYQAPAVARAASAAANRDASNETLTLKVRYKEPTGTESKLISIPLVDRDAQFTRASADFRFAASVAEFGMILRESPYRGKASISEVLDNAQGGRGTDRNGYRQEFINLVTRARSIRGIE